MYLINACIRQLDNVKTQEKPCMMLSVHGLDPLLNKCDREEPPLKCF